MIIEVVMTKAKQLNENTGENLPVSQSAQLAKPSSVKKKRRKIPTIAPINATNSDANAPAQPIFQLEHLKIKLSSFRPYEVEKTSESSKQASQSQHIVYTIISRLINECEKKLQDCEQANEEAVKNALLEAVNQTFAKIENFIKTYQAAQEALHTLSSSPLYKILGLVDLIEHHQITFNGYTNKVFENISDLPQAIDELTSISQELEPFVLQMDVWAQPYAEIQQYLKKITNGFTNKEAMIEIHQKALYTYMSSSNNLKQRIASLNDFKVEMEILENSTSSIRHNLTAVELEIKKLEDMCGVLSKVVIPMDKPEDIKKKNQLLELLKKGTHNLQVFTKKYVTYVSDYHTLNAEQKIMASKSNIENFTKLHRSLKRINIDAVSLCDAYIEVPRHFQEEFVDLPASKAVSPERQKQYIEKKLQAIRKYQVILSQIEHVDNNANSAVSWDPNGILKDPTAHKKWSREILPELTLLDPELAKEYTEANIDQLSLSQQVKTLNTFAKRFHVKAKHFKNGLKKFLEEQEALAAPVLVVNGLDMINEPQESEQPSAWQGFTASVQLAANGFQQAVATMVTDASKHTSEAVATVSTLFVEKPMQSETVIVEPIIEDTIEQAKSEPVQVSVEEDDNPAQAPAFDSASITGLTAAEIEAAETKAILEKELRKATDKAVFEKIDRKAVENQGTQDEFAAYISMSKAPVVVNVSKVVIEEELDNDADEEADEDFYKSTFPKQPQPQPKPAPSFKANLKTVMSLSLLGMIKEAKGLFEKHAHREPTAGEETVLKTASMVLYICTAGLLSAGKAAASVVKTGLFGLFDKKPAKVVSDVDNGPYIPGMKDLNK